ncbi:MAG: hypothetical protein ACI9S8_000019 [Chlamydiales bacterium]
MGNVRCGATWLQSLLSKSDQISCGEELRWRSSASSSKHRVHIEQGSFDVSEYLGTKEAFAEIVGSKLLLDPQRYDDEDLSKFLGSVDSDTRIVHIQRNYKDILKSIIQNQGYRISKHLPAQPSNVLQGILELQKDSPKREQKFSVKECEAITAALYQNDNRISLIQKDRSKYLAIEYEEIQEQLPNILKFIGVETYATQAPKLIAASELKKLPKMKEPSVLKYSKTQNFLRAYEGLRTFLLNINYISEEARSSLGDTEIFNSEVKVYQQPLGNNHFPVSVFVDILPSHEFLEKFFKEDVLGKDPVSIVIIFSNISVVKEILLHSSYKKLISQGNIKLWHISEWDKKFIQELENLRSPLPCCNNIVVQRNHPLESYIRAALLQGRENFVKRHSAARKIIEEYYQSTAFQKRLKNIQKGEKLRLYFERACTSIAVKRFTDNCAESFRKLGHEVFVHKPCSGGAIDLVFSSEIEVASFKPDLIVRSPNIVKGYQDMVFYQGVPSLYSLQDRGPHLDCARYLEKSPLSKHDILFFLLPDFHKIYIDAGAKESQLLKGFIPAEEAKFDVELFKANENVEVAYVKTLFPYRHVRDLFEAETDEERKQADRLEEKILDTVETEGAIDPMRVAAWGLDRIQEETLLSYYHSKFSLKYIEFLRKEGFELGLSGANWDLIPGLKRYCLGHAESREDYQMRFLSNKINLSINPWDRFHPRVFEGGVCGAFFLVFKVPEELTSCRMPDEMIPGTHFDYFSTPEELKEKCCYYLDNEKLRKQIGQNLRKLVQEHFSYTKLCSEFLIRFRSSIEKGNES